MVIGLFIEELMMLKIVREEKSEKYKWPGLDREQGVWDSWSRYTLTWRYATLFYYEVSILLKGK